MAANPEASTVKARRAAAREAGEAVRAAEIPPLADRPVMVGEDVARRFPTLGDPREPRMVAEAGGSLFGLNAGDTINGYVIAPEDAAEILYPRGCTTPTSRLLWAKGQHVPTEVYEKWVAAQTPAPEVLAVPEVPPPPGAPD